MTPWDLGFSSSNMTLDCFVLCDGLDSSGRGYREHAVADDQVARHDRTRVDRGSHDQERSATRSHVLGTTVVRTSVGTAHTCEQ